LLTARKRDPLAGQQWLITVIPATWETDVGGSQLKASLGKKLTRLSSQQASVVVHYVIPAMQEEERGGSWSKASPGQRVRPYLKK
jgi:hypothetical protein